jgi:hypothetical protein
MATAPAPENLELPSTLDEVLALEERVTAEILLRSKAAGSFLEYCRAVYAGFEEPWHVRLLIEHLEMVERGELKRLMVFEPPRHGKSQTTSINIPAWYLGRSRQGQIIGRAHSDSLATEEVGLFPGP